MKTRALVVNADDFGLTPGVNAGIIDAHTRGILTSASVFANASATDHAIQLARRTPTLGVGCHLALVDADPVLPSSRLPTLAADGHFRPTWRSFIADALAGRIAVDEIERELAAQIGRLSDAGLRLTHLDAHNHVHAFPPVFGVVARLARRFGIATVRIPYESPSLALVAWNAGRPGARRQAMENVALAPWAWRDRLLLRRHGLAPAPAFFGRVLTGMFTRDDVGRVLERMGPGVSELMTHPGYPDAALDLVRTRLRQERAAEVAVLTDPAIADLVRREGIALVRHGQAEQPAAPDSRPAIGVNQPFKRAH
jgi:hopanoid biosynthesis associated protein HpnK